MYRSGDYAKWDNDGNVLILGRMDNQVKLRGLRIELSEIEGLMEEQDGIIRAVAAVRRLNGQDNLCAWFTAKKEIDLHALKDALSKKLTHYMVPAALMQVDAIPITLNGKTDLKALPEPATMEQGGYEPPANELERFFCSLFEKVLKLDRVGALDDFFAIGGTSLAATSIMIEATDAGYKLKYSDVFKYKTPRELASIFSNEEEVPAKTLGTLSFDRRDYTKINEVLSKNTISSFQTGNKREIGNILLTGATGYMGIHVLAEYLRTEEGKAYCLVRKGRFDSAQKRLKNMLFYYFGDEFANDSKRIEAVDGDVTDYAAFEALRKLPVDTVFNCAANVKHFSSGTDIEDINVGGALNCIRFCEETGARLIHFSTTSVAGALIVSSPSEIRALDEKSLYFGQVLENQYTSSKMQAEIEVLSAVADKELYAKVIRVGTLAARESDGEFQINFLSNSSMGRLRSFAILKKFPYMMLNSPLRMGPIDISAKSFLHLSRTPKECTVFHAINSHVIPMIDVIRIMNECGMEIALVEDREFEQALLEAEKDPRKAAIFQSMLAYQGMNGNAVPVQVKCEYSAQVLGRIGFYWNATDREYIRKFIEGLSGLGFFDEDNLYR